MGQATSKCFGWNEDEAEDEAPSSSNGQWSYEVFLNFRGADTRKSIVAELHKRLSCIRGIKTFKDDTDLEKGDPISPVILEAIEQSRFAIVVLSEHYADSAWCLDELVKICQCMQEGRRIFPIFYGVEPADVRYQKKSFGIAFQRYEESGRHKNEKVKRWRDALNKVGNISGWTREKFETDSELVHAIVEDISSQVPASSILSEGDFYPFEATKQAMDKVMEALKDGKITAIKVYGLGGVGKTALVEHAGREALNQGLFDYVIKIVVTQNLDLRKVQGTLADGLGISLTQESEGGRANRLKKQIIDKMKVLIIVDDVWDTVPLASIGIPSFDKLKQCSSKVIFTTRIERVCREMGSLRNVTLTVLSEADSWALFVKNARRSIKLTDFEEVAKRVARECGGLPIALIAVARALGDKEQIWEWSTAARRLEKSQNANLDDKGVAYRCIKLSYDYLNDKDCKLCFLLCCLFPEDSSINIEQLLRYAIGQGLFRDVDTIEEARNTINSTVNYLINSSLLMDTGHDKSVKMHDVIRDTAIRIAQSEERFMVRAGHRLKDYHGLPDDCYSTISLMNNHIRKLPEGLVFPQLKILLLNENIFLEIPEIFFQSLQELRVLDLSGTRILKLPMSLSLLKNLQVFLLDYCSRHISNISVLKNLKKLEILSLRSCAMKELLRDIGDLTSLKMLDLTGVQISTIPSGILSKLSNLEELYINAFSAWGRKIEGSGEETNASFEEVTGLSKLRVLEAQLPSVDDLPEYVEFNPNWVKFILHIGSSDRSTVGAYDHNSIILTLDGTMRTLPSWFSNVVVNRADKLVLDWPRGGLIGLFSGYDHGCLHRIKYLSVKGSPNRTNTTPTSWTPREPVFKKLEKLRLYHLDCEFCVTKLLPESLVNLKLLKIARCTNWGKVLLPSHLLERLPNLRKVFCYEVDDVCSVVGCVGLSVPTNLSDMQFYRLAALRSICDGPAPPAMFQALKTLIIFRCRNLQGSLFSYDTAQHLSQLDNICIFGCPLLERIIEANNQWTVLPKLKNLTLWKLKKLFLVSAIAMECPSLVHLYVKECPKTSVSFSDFNSRKPFQLNKEIIHRLEDINPLNEFPQF